MKKEDILKIAALIIIPGAIPVYLGYLIYDKKRKSNKCSVRSADGTSTSEDN